MPVVRSTVRWDVKSHGVDLHHTNAPKITAQSVTTNSIVLIPNRCFGSLSATVHIEALVRPTVGVADAGPSGQNQPRKTS